MGKYTITDPETGKKVTVSGEVPPSPEDAEQIFVDAGLRKQGPLKQAGNVALKALNFPSELVGGATQATRESIQGTYEAPKIPLKVFGKEINAGEALLPTLVGAYRGVKEGQDLFTEVPETLEATTGIPKDSPVGFAAGLAAEVIMPDPLDAIAFGKFAKKILGKTGDVVETVGRKLSLQGIKPSPSQQQKFAKATGKTIEEFVSDNKLSGAVIENTIEMIKKTQSKFDEIVSNKRIRVPVENLVNSISSKIDELQGTILGKTTNKGIINAFEEMRDELLEKAPRYKNGVSVEELTKIRRQIDDMIPDNAWARLFSNGDVHKNIQKRFMLQEIIQDATIDIVDESGRGLQELGQQLKGLYSLEKIAEKQSFLGKASGVVGLRNTLAGLTVGSLTGDDIQEKVKNGLAAYVGTSIANNPKVVSAISNVILKTSDAFKKSEKFAKALELILRSGKEITMEEIRDENISQNELAPEATNSNQLR